MEDKNSTTTKERTFYIRVSNLNIENGKSLYVGPFKTTKEAQDVIDQARYNGQELMDGDEFVNEETLNIQIIGGTLAKREGMKEPLDSMPLIEKWQTYFSGGDIYKSNRGRPKKDESQLPPDETEEEEVQVQQVQPKKTKTQRTNTMIQLNNAPSRTKQKEYVIVSNRIGIIIWLNELGYRGEVLSYISHPEQIRGKIVIGVVPPWIAQYAEKIGVPNIPGLNSDQSKDITIEQIKAAGGKLDWYKVIKVDE